MLTTTLPARPKAALAAISLPPLPAWFPPEMVREVAAHLGTAAQPPGPRTDLRPIKAMMWELVHAATGRYQNDTMIILAHIAADVLDGFATYRR